MTTPNWDTAYTGSVPAPWDIGRPQPAFLAPDAFEVNPETFGSATAQAWLADIIRAAPARA